MIILLYESRTGLPLSVTLRIIWIVSGLLTSGATKYKFAFLEFCNSTNPS